MKTQDVKFKVTKIEDSRKNGSTIEIGSIYDGILNKNNNAVWFNDVNDQSWVFWVNDTCELIDQNEQFLTELEQQVVSALKDGDDFEDMPTECIENLEGRTGMSTKVLRGVLSSLIKKDIVQSGEFPNGLTAFHYRGISHS